MLAEDGPPPDGLPLPRLERYAGQILRALHELHGLGVVMRDLKPQNLLLDSAQASDTIRDELVLTDFGLSKVISHTIGSYTVTAVGQGTPDYM